MTNAVAGGRRQGFAVASLVLGIVGLPTLGLVGIGALLGIIFGVVALVKASGAPEEYGGKGKAIVGIALSVVSVMVMPFFLGIIAAIAIPSLLRARVAANERAAIEEAQTVVAAETIYRGVNGGYYDTLDCLTRPSACVPGHAKSPFIDPAIARQEPRHGYRASFHPGPAAPPGKTGISRSSITSYAYVLVPEAPGQTGVRSFCSDGTGRTCFKPDGSAPDVSEGVCPNDCTDLR